MGGGTWYEIEVTSIKNFYRKDIKHKTNFMKKLGVTPESWPVSSISYLEYHISKLENLREIGQRIVFF